jgi:hypothetical protein
MSTPAPLTSQATPHRYGPVAESRAPVVVLAFANDRASAERSLRNLPEERRRVLAELRRATDDGACAVVDLPNATAAELLEAFQRPATRDRVAVLHYGGHAGSYELLLETAAGAPHVADGAGLAAFLGQQRGLQLVVLNGCATQGHVRALLDACIGTRAGGSPGSGGRRRRGSRAP